MWQRCILRLICVSVDHDVGLHVGLLHGSHTNVCSDCISKQQRSHIWEADEVIWNEEWKTGSAVICPSSVTKTFETFLQFLELQMGNRFLLIGARRGASGWGKGTVMWTGRSSESEETLAGFLLLHVWSCHLQVIISKTTIVWAMYQVIFPSLCLKAIWSLPCVLFNWSNCWQVCMLGLGCPWLAEIALGAVKGNVKFAC